MNELFLESPELRALDLEIDNLVLGMHAQNTYMESVGVYTEAATVESIKKSLSLIIERVVKFLQDLADKFKTGVNKTIAEVRKLKLGNITISVTKDYPKEVKDIKRIVDKIKPLIGNTNITRDQVKSIEKEFYTISSKKGKKPSMGAKFNMKLNDMAAAGEEAERLNIVLTEHLVELNNNVQKYAEKLGVNSHVDKDASKNTERALGHIVKQTNIADKKDYDQKIKDAQEAQLDMIIIARDAAKESARTSMEMDRLMRAEIQRARMEQIRR